MLEPLRKRYPSDIPLVAMPARVTSVMSNVERVGAVHVPPRLDIRCVFGNIELDLSDAEFGPGMTEIDVRSVFGNVEIRLPHDAHVENHGEAMVGNFSGGQDNAAGLPSARIRVTGNAVFGNVELETD